MSSKKQITLTIDEDIKHDFQIQCVTNGVSMSETIEFMMEHYVKTCKNLEKEV